MRRQAELSIEQFREYYESRHAPLVAALTPPSSRYRRNHIQALDSASIGAERLDFDAIVELEFTDRTAYEAWLAAVNQPDARRRIASDITRYNSALVNCDIEGSADDAQKQGWRGLGGRQVHRAGRGSIAWSRAR